MDRITVRAIRAHGRHGVLEVERDVAQPFDIDLIVHADLTKSQTSDTLEDTLDYAAMQRTVVRIVEDNSFFLIERLARVIADTLLEGDARIVRCEVTVAKPEILSGATPAVTIVRCR